ncbi:hypothetical protein EVJ58_g6768 [Rhodofomes roseus]|uniref:Alpha/beta hydrolase fold-3 domain-containing protein n=1 Tax=Rhodofomes roseus TaxID=34475 RepID=A0A4Y9Y5V0_9APHY|nr:hypothetical protein EVJ58_g6768 [Rhodofomes roseus]
MDVIANLTDTDVPLIIGPTTGAFMPGLEKHRAEIESIQVKTFKYGSTDRHMLDVYYPPEDTIPASGKTRVLHFFYGGGFVSGARKLPAPYDLGCYASTGAYFAKRGILTVIADYRLVPHVKYPQPIEDVRDSISWVVANGTEIVGDTGIQADFDNVFLMGHSAGTIYISTLLFHPTLLTPELRSHIRGVILKSGIFRFPRDESVGAGNPLLQLYGGWDEVEANMPITLLNQASGELLTKFPKVLMFAGEREPDGFFPSNEEFKETLETKLGKQVKLIVMKGHNHASPHWALWSGAGEEWAEKVVRWIHYRA